MEVEDTYEKVTWWDSELWKKQSRFVGEIDLMKNSNLESLR